jgi:phage FluMu protein Com
MITVTCVCGQVLRASDAFAGTKVTCPSCRKAVTIPSPPQPRDAIDEHKTATQPLVDLESTLSDH